MKALVLKKITCAVPQGIKELYKLYINTAKPGPENIFLTSN
jgi:hypothetical protein